MGRALKRNRKCSRCGKKLTEENSYRFKHKDTSYKQSICKLCVKSYNYELTYKKKSDHEVIKKINDLAEKKEILKKIFIERIANENKKKMDLALKTHSEEEIIRLSSGRGEKDLMTLCAWTDECPIAMRSCEECGFMTKGLFTRSAACEKLTKLGYRVVEIEKECLPNI